MNLATLDSLIQTLKSRYLPAKLLLMLCRVDAEPGSARLMGNYFDDGVRQCIQGSPEPQEHMRPVTITKVVSLIDRSPTC